MLLHEKHGAVTLGYIGDHEMRRNAAFQSISSLGEGNADDSG